MTRHRRITRSVAMQHECLNNGLISGRLGFMNHPDRDSPSNPGARLWPDPTLCVKYSTNSHQITSPHFYVLHTRVQIRTACLRVGKTKLHALVPRRVYDSCLCSCRRTSKCEPLTLVPSREHILVWLREPIGNSCSQQHE
ncbi:hypothetical protein NDU88_002932 [Pleurodeles waltl]|uniref:Uncharacterized protein n=1 Tax=Pleurodeles waltl TaxID=8319 RepID=A0AAV7NGU2_PLEWA|nr:hypothetical protein NDU88_002932 [Pleurodeles waltl]